MNHLIHWVLMIGGIEGEASGKSLLNIHFYNIYRMIEVHIMKNKECAYGYFFKFSEDILLKDSVGCLFGQGRVV